MVQVFASNRSAYRISICLESWWDIQEMHSQSKVCIYKTSYKLRRKQHRDSRMCAAIPHPKQHGDSKICAAYYRIKILAQCPIIDLASATTSC